MVCKRVYGMLSVCAWAQCKVCSVCVGSGSAMRDEAIVRLAEALEINCNVTSINLDSE